MKPAPPRRAWLVAISAVGGLLLVAGTVALGLAIPRAVVADPTPERECWNGLVTDPCLPLDGITGAMWAFDPNQVVAADCDRLRNGDYVVEAEEAWYCTWPDLRADVFVARFPTTDEGLAIWRDMTNSNGFREIESDLWPNGEGLGPGFVGSMTLTKDIDAPVLALCYDAIPYCLEIDALSQDVLEAAEDRVATLTSGEVEDYVAQQVAESRGDV